jgi:peptide/nickel transport system substrate-binding protein
MLRRDILKLAAMSGLASALFGPNESWAQETPRSGGTLTVAMQNDAKSLDPTFQINFSERQPLYMIYNTLVGLNPDFSFRPELAERWETSADGKTLTLILRQGVKFHDGSSFDSSAVKWNIERRLDKEVNSPSRSQLLEIVASVEALDPTTVLIKMKEASPSLLGMLGQREGFMISPQAAEKFGNDLGRNPVGTGPFVFKSWEPGQRIVVNKNEAYWEQGKPYLDSVIFMLISNSAVAVPRLLTREVDFVSGLSPIDVRTLGQQQGLTLAPSPGSRWLALQMIVDRPPFNNPKLRQAMAYAIDRKRLIDVLTNGQSKIAEGFTPPGLWWFDPNLESYSYDPDKAKALIAEIGDTANAELVLSTQPVPIYQQISQLALEQFQAVGLNAKIQPVSVNDWYPQLIQGTINFLPIRWTQRPDPDGLFTYLFHSKSSGNTSRYKSDEVDRLLDRARTITKQDDRGPLYNEVQEILTKDLPYIPLFFSVEYAAMRDNVRGFVWVADEIPRFRDVWKAS